MTEQGGIKVRNLHPSLQARLLPAQDSQADAETLQSSVAIRPGTKAIAELYIPANLVNGDTIIIGADTFEVDIINTDAGVNTANTDDTGPLAGTGTAAVLTLGAAPATAILAGDVLRVENELLLVLRVISTTQFVVARAYAGSAIAAHAKNLDVFVSDSVPLLGHISVPLVTTLTPVVFGPAMVAVFNWTPPASESAPIRTSTENANFTAVPTVGLDAGQVVLFIANEAGVDVTGTTEDFANSTDNVWGAATFTRGLEPSVGRVEAIEVVPTASEELVGELHVAFPFTVRAVLVQMRITSTDQQVAFTGAVKKGYVESTDATLPSTVVTLRNVGPASTAYITPFAATHTITITAFE